MESDHIVRDIQEGRHTAGKLLVDTYQVKVYNICFSMVHNSHDAEDLTQEVFIEVIKNISSFRGDAQLGTWIYRIAVNRSLNFIRSTKKRKWLMYIDEILSFKDNDSWKDTDASESYTLKDISSLDNQPLEINETQAMLQKAIDSLPKKQKTAFTLNKINELSYKEVAEIMNESHANVETLIHRAKLGLQKALNGYFR